MYVTKYSKIWKSFLTVFGYLRKKEHPWILFTSDHTHQNNLYDVYVPGLRGGLRPLRYCFIFINGLVYIRPYDSFTQVPAISLSMSSVTDSGGRGGRQHWCSSSSVTNRVHDLSVWVTSKDILAYSNGMRNYIYLLLVP